MRLLLLTALLWTLPAMANDNLMIFHQPDKVIVVVNEIGGGQLGLLFDQYAPEDAHLEWESENGAVWYGCNRMQNAPDPRRNTYSCTFKFFAGESVTINQNSMHASLGEGEHGGAEVIRMEFERHQGDNFFFVITERGLWAKSLRNR